MDRDWPILMKDGPSSVRIFASSRARSSEFSLRFLLQRTGRTEERKKMGREDVRYGCCGTACVHDGSKEPKSGQAHA